MKGGLTREMERAWLPPLSHVTLAWLPSGDPRDAPCEGPEPPALLDGSAGGSEPSGTVGRPRRALKSATIWSRSLRPARQTAGARGGWRSWSRDHTSRTSLDSDA